MYKVKDKKILFIMPNFLTGGAEKVAVDLAQGLKNKGWNVDFLLFKKQIDYDPNLFKNMTINHILNNNERIRNHLPQFFYRFFKIVKNYDILIGGLELYPSYLTVLAGKLFRKKTILINHTFLSRYLEILGFSKIHNFLSKFFIPRSDKIISISISAKNDLLKNFGAKNEKVKVIYNPINFLDIQQRAEESILEDEIKIFKKFTIIFVGKISRQKGIDILFKAFEIVLDKNIDVNLVILGKGNEENSLKNFAKELGVADRIYFLGLKKNPFKYITRATLFVLPSRVEGFPLVILEAMSCGCPVISTDCQSGPLEILDNGKYGILIKVEDIKGLADAIVELLLNENKRKLLREVGFERVKDFDVEKKISEYEEVLKNL